ncbi:hypothetical protein AAFX91_38015 [Bradyrhizobium sp. 31Argb]|uniref:hypothetical protein n=1 Tax=Bradyrhizobium sp. 31Argb TaxID=3141247 RepID=UPI0037498708
MTTLGNKRLRACLLALVGSALAGVSASAQQFSADLVTRQGEKVVRVGSLRVSESKVRIETTDFADGFFLVDGAKPAATFVRPHAKVFMDAMQSSPLTQMFVPVDPDEPCRQWRAMASLAAPVDPDRWHCGRDGEGTVGDRKADIYRIVAASGGGFVGWVDRERKFPVQIETVDGTMIAVENIRDEPQPAQSFEIPPGARKFDPRALIDRIRQSDVWVAPRGME